MAKYIIDFERPVVELEIRLEELKKNPSATQLDIAKEITFLEGQIAKLKKRVYSKLTPWQKVQLARHPDRPRFTHYLEKIFFDFLELHGDRLYGDDPAVIGGLACLENFKVVVVGQEKGKDVKERVWRNFGMPHPEGYRKSWRLFKMAEKFSLPVITFIDTPGAYPGVGAEERGQAHAIAENLKLLSCLKTPVVAVNIGEGGSGGALALGLADKILMLQNAYYSVISPEGCASILWDDSQKASEAAETLALTADALLKLKVIDEIVKEPLGGAHRDIDFVATRLKEALLKNLNELSLLSPEDLAAKRYEKFRTVGFFQEAAVQDAGFRTQDSG